MKFRYFLPLLALLGSVSAASLPVAQAQSTMDPEKTKLAAEEFDSGRRAYKSGDFSRAAFHFENAFRYAPSPQVLRMAIRSRRDGGQFARAATLCAGGLALYPDDAQTAKLARKVLDDVGPDLFEVTVDCDPACTVLIDGRLVRDDAATNQVVYTSVGNHTIVAGWGGSRHVSKEVTAKAGESVKLSFEVPAEKEVPPPKVNPPSTRPPVMDKEPVTSPGKASPTLFWLGAGVTTLFAGLTIASGIDTLKSPGTDTVREVCVGQGENCPEYQEGRDKQTRTNYLAASTAVGAVSVTVIGLFFTDWGDEVLSSEGVAVTPMADFVGQGMGMAATGRF